MGVDSCTLVKLGSCSSKVSVLNEIALTFVYWSSLAHCNAQNLTHHVGLFYAVSPVCTVLIVAGHAG